MKEIPFIKMDGLGNDFFIIEPENSDINLLACKSPLASPTIK